MTALMTAAVPAARVMSAWDMTARGISEGHQLRLAATTLSIPVNPG